LNAVRLAAETHAAQLAVVAGARDVRVIERALPAALADRPAASFLWPLGKEPVFRLGENDDENPMDRRERQPNVLRSKFLDDERLVRPVEETPRERPERPMVSAPKPILKADTPRPTPTPAVANPKPPVTTTPPPAANKSEPPKAAKPGAERTAPSKKKPAKAPPAAKKPSSTRAPAKKAAAPAKKKKR